MKNKILLLCLITAIGSVNLHAQEDDLEALLEDEMGPTREYTLGTFLSAYIMNNPSVELIDKNGINFFFSHKFGYLNSGAENFFGFDYASVYSGVNYAPTNWLNFGVGRGSFRKSVNGNMKLRLLRQASGDVNIPVSVVLYGELDYQTSSYSNQDMDEDRIGRIEYTSQLLIARKFGHNFSLQLMPSWVHRNLVKTTEDRNDVLALGVGASLKVQRRLRVNFEYFWVQDHNTTNETFYHPVSLGICYQTSRHAFEVFATNSTGITSNNHIAYTTGNILDGEISIGFNISTVFSVK